jgi:MFS family permease
MLADKIGYKKIFLSGLVLFAIVYAGFAFNPSIATIFILFSVYGLFSAATDGVSKAWITNTAHNKNTATAIGFYTSCQSICTLGASTIAGLVWEQLGSFYTFISTAAIAFIVFVFFLLKLKNE